MVQIVINMFKKIGLSLSSEQALIILVGGVSVIAFLFYFGGREIGGILARLIKGIQ